MAMIRPEPDAVAQFMEEDVLAHLTGVLQERLDADPESSYVASLYAKGLDAVLAKVDEEAGETIEAARQAAEDSDPVVRETADLWFHTMVMLVQLGRRPDEVLTELARRFGTSGLEEKASRPGAGVQQLIFADFA